MTKSKNTRNQKRAAGKKAQGNKFGFIRALIVCVIIIAILIPFWNNMVTILKRDELIKELTQEHAHRKIKNDALEQKVEAPTDDEYIREIAKGHGYRDSGEIIFYLNDGE